MVRKKSTDSKAQLSEDEAHAEYDDGRFLLFIYIGGFFFHASAMFIHACVERTQPRKHTYIWIYIGAASTHNLQKSPPKATVDSYECVMIQKSSSPEARSSFPSRARVVFLPSPLSLSRRGKLSIYWPNREKIAHIHVYMWNTRTHPPTHQHNLETRGVRERAKPFPSRYYYFIPRQQKKARPSWPIPNTLSLFITFFFSWYFYICNSRFDVALLARTIAVRTTPSSSCYSTRRSPTPHNFLVSLFARERERFRRIVRSLYTVVPRSPRTRSSLETFNQEDRAKQPRSTGPNGMGRVGSGKAVPESNTPCQLRDTATRGANVGLASDECCPRNSSIERAPVTFAENTAKFNFFPSP